MYLIINASPFVGLFKPEFKVVALCWQLEF